MRLSYYQYVVYVLLICLIIERFTCCSFVVTYPKIIFIIMFISRIIYFISTTMPQTSHCVTILKSLYWHNNIKIFSIVYKCAFDTNNLNRPLYLKVSFLFLITLLSPIDFHFILLPVALILPFTTIYSSI